MKTTVNKEQFYVLVRNMGESRALDNKKRVEECAK